MIDLLKSLFTVLLSVFGGAWIAHRWQTRSRKEDRFFDASKVIYDRMIEAAERIADLAGRRIYALQRVCLTDPGAPTFRDSYDALRQVNFEWNNALLQLEISVRTLFRNSHLAEFEEIQGNFSALNLRISKLRENKSVNRLQLLNDVNRLRGRMFQFTQGMFREINTLNRQMHFGVKIPYNSYELDKISTIDLIKLLFNPVEQEKGIVRSPFDFGDPVLSSDARFGINE